MKYFINKVNGLLSRVTLSCLDKDLTMVVGYDKKIMEIDHLLPEDFEPRVFIKITCTTACRNTGAQEIQHGRKWYLSEHMTDDEIVKTAHAAYIRFITHEAEEGFKMDGKPLFNPHTDYEALLAVCEQEIART